MGRPMRTIGAYADVAQLVERHLAMVKVAGSRPVIRSNLRSRLPTEALAQVGYRFRMNGSCRFGWQASKIYSVAYVQNTPRFCVTDDTAKHHQVGLTPPPCISRRETRLFRWCFTSYESLREFCIVPATALSSRAFSAGIVQW